MAEVIHFTADQHFGHGNIIRYCNRPFRSVDEMNAVLIERWNSVVKPDDIVYQLGDFVWGDDLRGPLAYLNGDVRILSYPWHHDARWLRNHFGDATLQPPVVVLERPELSTSKWPQVIVLCHYPFAVWDRKHYGAWHLHGHSHGQYHGEGLIYDVGVDANNFTPVSLDRIREIMGDKAEIAS